MDMQYIFPAGANNGKVSQTVDGVLGETVAYQYDALNRLITATASNNSWGEAYSFDGFGNLQSKTPTVGTAPTGGGATPATNQPTGVSVDANGNTLGSASTPYVWDVENRLLSSSTTSPATNYYYDPWGKRIWKEIIGTGGATTGEIYIYGVGGQKLETYTYSSTSGIALAGTNLYYGPGGKLLQSKGAWVATDRQGTVRANSNSESFSYFPYGEERTSTANGREKFGSYTRDANGQDYAGARYFNSNSGAFWSPDPSGLASVNLSSPLSWNRYLYVLGDPVNFSDSSGRNLCDDDWDVCAGDYVGDGDSGGGGGGDDGDDDQTGGGRGGSASMTTLGGVGGIIVQDPTVTTVIVNATLPDPVQTQTSTSTVTTALVTGIGTATDVLIGVVGLLLIQTGSCGSQPCGATNTGTGTETQTPISGTYNVTDPQWVQANCMEVGLPVIVPSTNKRNKGGVSVEQEYLCPDGNTYTVETLKTAGGGTFSPAHTRPGKPKHGASQ